MDPPKTDMCSINVSKRSRQIEIDMDENEESINNYIIYIFIGSGEETKLSSASSGKFSSFILWI